MRMVWKASMVSQGETTNVIFVTWDGEGQSFLEGLYLPMFERLKRLEPSIELDILQFVRPGDRDVPGRRRAVERAGFRYFSHSVPGAGGKWGTALAIGSGAARLRLLTKHKKGVILARSVLPAAVVLGSSLLKKGSWTMCFDADGFVEDERVEFAGWKSTSANYQVMRWLENLALLQAASILTRTPASKDILSARAGPEVHPDRIIVLPNGRDEHVFAPATRESRSRARRRHSVGDDDLWIVALGSLGEQYCPNTTMELFRQTRQLLPTAKFSWITQQTSAAQLLLEEFNLPGSSTFSLRPEDVPEVLAAADYGIALRRPSFSQCAVSPVKWAEMLLCGVPFIATRGFGDLEPMVAENVCYPLDPDEPTDVARSAHWLAESFRTQGSDQKRKARAFGLDRHGLDRFAEGYLQGVSEALCSPSGRQRLGARS